MERRRRDEAADAPSSGSRVILCPLHHATPADDAPRCCCTAVLPRHRLSNSNFLSRAKQVKIPRLASLARDDGLRSPFCVDALGVELIVLLHRISMVRRETPHLAPGARGASPTAPLRAPASH